MVDALLVEAEAEADALVVASLLAVLDAVVLEADAEEAALGASVAARVGCGSMSYSLFSDVSPAVTVESLEPDVDEDEAMAAAVTNLSASELVVSAALMALSSTSVASSLVISSSMAAALTAAAAQADRSRTLSTRMAWTGEDSENSVVGARLLAPPGLAAGVVVLQGEGVDA